MRDFRALLALMAVARTTVGKIFPSTMAPSNKGPKNGTCGKRDDMIYEHLLDCKEQNKYEMLQAGTKYTFQSVLRPIHTPTSPHFQHEKCA